MIRLLTEKDEVALLSYLMKDPITNYFILLSLERSNKNVKFEKKWGAFNDQGELQGVLLKRRTRNMQFYAHGQYTPEAFLEIMKREKVKRLIGEKQVLKGFMSEGAFKWVEEGAFISELKDKIKQPVENLDFKKLRVEDIDKVITLYEKSFEGFTPREIMIDKFKHHKGRGYYLLQDKQIIAVAQTAYETETSAIIVGVATDPNYRGQGLATQLMTKLCNELILEGKTLYLQYNNPSAGHIYKKLGFKDQKRMINLSGMVSYR